MGRVAKEVLLTCDGAQHVVGGGLHAVGREPKATREGLHASALAGRNDGVNGE